MKRILFLIAISAVMVAACGTTPTPTPEPTPRPTRTPSNTPMPSLTPTETPVPTNTPIPTPVPPRPTRIDISCSNTLSDSDIVNRAISQSPEGAEIVIGGHCLLNQPIRLLGNRAYRGTSRTGTVLKQAPGADLVALLASDSFLDNTAHTGLPVSVRHLSLDGDRASNPQAQTAGIILRSWLSVVEDVYIANMAGDGLRVTNRSADGTLLDTTQVNGRIAGNFIENSGRHGVFVEDSQNAVTDWILSDNWIEGSGVNAIHLENTAGWFVERNHVYGVPQTAIYANRLFASSISNNYIEGFGETGQAGTWHGILATVQGGAASTIVGNRIFNFKGENNGGSVYRYLAISVNYGTGLVSVTGNTIRGAGTPLGVGLYYAAVEGTQLIIASSGNIVEDVNTRQFTNPRVLLSTGQ